MAECHLSECAGSRGFRLCRSWVVALENSLDESLVNGSPVPRPECLHTLASFLQRRRTFASPHERVQHEAIDAVRRRLGEGGRPERAGREAINEKALGPGLPSYYFCSRLQVLDPAGDIGVALGYGG